MARYSYSRQPRRAASRGGRRRGASVGRTRLRSGARRTSRSAYRGARETRLVIQVQAPGANTGPIAAELANAMTVARKPSNKAKF